MHKPQLLTRSGALKPATTLRTATQAPNKPGGGRERCLANLKKTLSFCGTNQKTQA